MVESPHILENNSLVFNSLNRFGHMDKSVPLDLCVDIRISHDLEHLVLDVGQLCEVNDRVIDDNQSGIDPVGVLADLEHEVIVENGLPLQDFQPPNVFVLAGNLQRQFDGFDSGRFPLAECKCVGKVVDVILSECRCEQLLERISLIIH